MPLILQIYYLETSEQKSFVQDSKGMQKILTGAQSIPDVFGCHSNTIDAVNWVVPCGDQHTINE